MFKKPLNSTILSLLLKDDAEEVEEIWKEKFKLIYKHQVFDTKNNKVSVEVENKELERQSYRFN